MPPGRTLVLVTENGDAVWGTHWPQAELALDGLDAWRCSIFRNEGPLLSSMLGWPFAARLPIRPV